MAKTIVGIGVDIQDIRRFRTLQSDTGFLKKAFTSTELAYCRKKEDPLPSLAVRFCAKEAAVKACPFALSPSSVEVVMQGGKPELKVNSPKWKWLAHLSVSHSGDYAVAMVVLTAPPRAPD